MDNAVPDGGLDRVYDHLVCWLDPCSRRCEQVPFGPDVVDEDIDHRTRLHRTRCVSFRPIFV